MKRAFKTIGWMLVLAVVVVIIGCAKTGKEKVVKLAVESSFKYTETGMDEYDDFLSTSQELIYKLDLADYAIRNIVPKFKKAASTIIGFLGDAQDLSDDIQEVGQIFTSLAESLKKAQIVLTVFIDESGYSFKVKPETEDVNLKPGLIQQVEDALDEVNDAIGNLKSIPDNLAEAVEQAKSLISQGTDLVISAKDDFTGLNARKLPGCTSSMKE
ncbi:unnamed protein product, partial [marine sediment metagenome]